MRHWIMWAWIAGLFATAGTVGATEKLFETSFEDGSGKLPPGWEVKYGKEGRFEWTRGIAHTGKRGIHIVDASKTDAAGLRGPKIPVSPGDRVWVEAWFYAEKPDSAAVYIECWDTQGKRSQKATTSHGVRSPGGKWGSVVARVRIPDGIAHVTLLLYSSSTVETDGYFDDVSFGKGAKSTIDRTPRPPATVKHPCGPYSEEDIARARENVKRHAWAKKQLDRYKRGSAFYMNLPDDEIAEWIPELTPFRVLGCPHCGAAWSYAWDASWARRQKPPRIRCRKCGAVFPNEKYPESKTEILVTPTGKEIPHPYYEDHNGKKYRIGGYLRYTRVSHLSSLGSMGRYYALTGDKAYAEKAVKVMRRLAQVYPDYVPHDWYHIYLDYHNTQSGKLSGWKLHDCTTFLEIGICYDLIYNSGVLTEDDKVLIENGLFRELGEFLLPIPQKGCCVNDGPFQMSAAALMGVLLGEHRYVEWAVEPPNGFLGFVHDYFFRDGHWSDGSASYEAMTLNKLYMLPEILQGYSDPPSYQGKNRYSNLDVINDPLVKKVHQAPLYAMLPDRRFAPFNDSAKRTGYAKRHAEVQNYWYPSERNRQILNWVYKGEVDETGTQYSLFRRDPNADFSREGQVCLSDESLLRPGAGWAFVREPSTTTTLVLDYGEPCHWHGHPDRLNFILYAHDREVVTDLGYLGARHHFRPWMARGVCHNVVMVDGKDQAREPGRLICFQPGEKVQAVVAEAPDTYEACSKYERAQLLITPALGVQYIADVFRVEGGEQHDFSFHGDGEDFHCTPLEDAPPFKGPVGPKEGGYDWFQSPRTTAAPTEIVADWRFGPQDLKAADTGVRLTMLGASGELISALGPNLRDARSPYEMPTVEFLVQRRPGPRNTFVSVIEPVKGSPAIASARQLRVADTAAGAFRTVVLRVDHTQGFEIILIAPDRQAVSETKTEAAGTVRLRGRLAVLSFDKQGNRRFAWMGDADRLESDKGGLEATGCHEGALLDFNQNESWFDVDTHLPKGAALAGAHIHVGDRLDGVYRIDRIETRPQGSRIHLRYEPVMKVRAGEPFRIPTHALAVGK